MKKEIDLATLRVDCNIGKLSIQNLLISWRAGEHATAEIEAFLDPSKVGCVSGDLSGQPICIRIKDSEDVLFYGVIFSAQEYFCSGVLTLQITARSLSWMLDLEKKYRSFQKTEQTHSEIVSAILEEYGASADFNINDRPIEKPYIQYNETDWEFVRRISSRLEAQVVPMARSDFLGIHVGFPIGKSASRLDTATYRFALDDEFCRNRSGYKGQYVYYDVDDCIPRHIGDAVLFQGDVWYVCESTAWVDKSKSVLLFTYRLAGANYCKALPEYNPVFRGRSLTGKVIERQAEKLRLHLDIDEEQNVGDAYFYTWLPESGNIMYNMPPLETSVSLYSQNADEQSAICIRNVRANGSVCPLTQDVTQRFLMTEPGKSLSLKPETMDLTATETGDSALLDDNFGCHISSKKEVVIKAVGNISIRGAAVNMQAPKEVTTVRGNLGEPTVMNLCHNVDSTGGKGKFQATGKYFKRKGKKGNLTSIEYGAGETNPEAEQEKREKLKFELAKLTRQNENEPQYDISDVFQTALSAIPQRAPNDEFSRFSAGSRVLFGKTEDYMHVVISEKWRDWEKSGNKQGDSINSNGDIKSNNRRDATQRQAKGNTSQNR